MNNLYMMYLLRVRTNLYMYIKIKIENNILTSTQARRNEKDTRGLGVYQKMLANFVI